MVNVNRRRLKLAPNAKTIDLIFVEPRQVGVLAKFDFPRVRARAPRDKIEHRAFAGAVGADDDAQLSLIHVKVEVGNRLKAVKSLVDVFQHENESSRRRAHLLWPFGRLNWTAGVGLARRSPPSFCG